MLHIGCDRSGTHFIACSHMVKAGQSAQDLHRVHPRYVTQRFKLYLVMTGGAVVRVIISQMPLSGNTVEDWNMRSTGEASG